MLNLALMNNKEQSDLNINDVSRCNSKKNDLDINLIKDKIPSDKSNFNLSLNRNLYSANFEYDNLDFELENKHNKNFFKRLFDSIKPGSLRGSTFAMASLTFGGGCLSFPYAIAQSGPLIGFVIFFITGLLSYITISYLFENGYSTRLMDYNDLTEGVLSRNWRISTDILNLIGCIGAIISYQYIITNLSLQVLHYFFNTPCDGITKIIQIIIAGTLIQIPLCSLKDISKLQYVCLVGTISLGLSILVVILECPFYIYQYFNNYSNNTIPIFPPKDSNIDLSYSWIDTIGIFLFGFTSHNGIFQVFQELERPGKRRCRKVINRSFIIELVFYFLLSLAGFLSSFYQTPDVFLKRKNLIGFNDYFIIIVRILLVLTMNSTIAVNYNVMRMSINSMVFKEKPSNLIDFSIVVIVIIISNVLNYLIKNAGTLLSFVGGFSLVLICFVVPILIDLKANPKNKKGLRKYFNYLFMIIVILVSIVCTIKGIYDFSTNDSIEDICKDI